MLTVKLIENFVNYKHTSSHQRRRMFIEKYVVVAYQQMMRQKHLIGVVMLVLTIDKAGYKGAA